MEVADGFAARGCGGSCARLLPRFAPATQTSRIIDRFGIAFGEASISTTAPGQGVVADGLHLLRRDGGRRVDRGADGRPAFRAGGLQGAAGVVISVVAELPLRLGAVVDRAGAAGEGLSGGQARLCHGADGEVRGGLLRGVRRSHLQPCRAGDGEVSGAISCRGRAGRRCP